MGPADIIKNFGALGAMACVLLVVLVLAYKYFDGLIEDAKLKRLEAAKEKEKPVLIPSEYTKAKLLSHPWFEYMEKEVRLEIPRMKMDDKCKEACLIDFMIIKFSSVPESMKNFINRKVAYDQSVTGGEWEHAIISTYMDAITTYESEMLDAGIPKMFIDAFNEYHATKINQLVSQTKNFSTAVQDNGLRTWCALDTLKIAFEATHDDATHVMRTMNGQLSAALIGYTRRRP
jgi:hypothetical protein